LSAYLTRFAEIICAANEPTIRSDVTLGGQLVIERSGNLTISYAPFEHIQRGARTLRANDDETLFPREFSLEGAEG